MSEAFSVFTRYLFISCLPLGLGLTLLPSRVLAEGASVLVAEAQEKTIANQSHFVGRVEALNHRLLIFHANMRSALFFSYAHQAFLGNGGYQLPLRIVDQAAIKTAGVGCAGAFHIVQQPFIHAEGMVKPDGVI